MHSVVFLINILYLNSWIEQLNFIILYSNGCVYFELLLFHTTTITTCCVGVVMTDSQFYCTSTYYTLNIYTFCCLSTVVIEIAVFFHSWMNTHESTQFALITTNENWLTANTMTGRTTVTNFFFFYNTQLLKSTRKFPHWKITPLIKIIRKQK